MVNEISVRETPEQVVLARRLTVAQADMGPTFSRTYQAIYAHLGRAGAIPAAPPFVVYHERLEPGPRWDIEICAPFVEPSGGFAPPAGFEVKRLARHLVVTTIHRGPYDEVGPAYDRMTAWAREHDYEFSGPPHEIYMSPPGTPPSQIETIIEQPVSSALVGATR